VEFARDGLNPLPRGCSVDPADPAPVDRSATDGDSGSPIRREGAEASCMEIWGSRWEQYELACPRLGHGRVSRFWPLMLANQAHLRRPQPRPLQTGDAGRIWKAMDTPWPGPVLKMAWRRLPAFRDLASSLRFAFLRTLPEKFAFPSFFNLLRHVSLLVLLHPTRTFLNRSLNLFSTLVTSLISAAFEPTPVHLVHPSLCSYVSVTTITSSA